jgi:hypothetical protein
LFAFGFTNAQAEEGGLQLNAGLGTSGWGTPVAGLDMVLLQISPSEENLPVRTTKILDRSREIKFYFFWNSSKWIII